MGRAPHSRIAAAILLAGCARSQDRAGPVAAPPAAGAGVEVIEPDPTTVPDLRPPPILDLALGDGTTCARFADRQVRCRGRLTLRAGALEGPLEVSDLAVCARADRAWRCLRDGLDHRVTTAFVQVARGAGARVGRDAEGAVWTFVGDAEDGAKLIPVPLPAPAVAVAADAQRSCALLRDGRLACWDPYRAMLGVPAPEVVARDVRGVDASYLRLCWHTDRAVRCWEDGPHREVPGIRRPTAIAVGRHHACALDGGRPVCWGRGGHGQLGGPERARTAVEVPLPAGAPPVAIDAGDDHTCVLREGGASWCWGRDDAGQATGDW